MFCGVCAVAKYGPGSSSRSEADRRQRADTAKSETTSLHCNIDQPASASGNSNSVVAETRGLSAEQDLMLTEVQEVIDCDTSENCDASSSDAVSYLSIEPSISSPQMTAEHVSAEAEVDQSCTGRISINQPLCSVTCDNSNSESSAAAGKLMQTQLQSRDARNALAEVFASTLLNQPNKPS